MVSTYLREGKYFISLLCINVKIYLNSYQKNVRAEVGKNS